MEINKITLILLNHVCIITNQTSTVSYFMIFINISKISYNETMRNNF